MALLAIINRMTGIAFVGIGACLDRMKKFKIAAMDGWFDGIPLCMTIHAKHSIAVTLLALIRILFGEDLMLTEPVGLVALRFRNSGGMTDLALVGAGQRRVGGIVTGVTTEPVDFGAITVGFRSDMAHLALDLRCLKKTHVHFMIINIVRMKFFLGGCCGG